MILARLLAAFPILVDDQEIWPAMLPSSGVKTTA